MHLATVIALAVWMMIAAPSMAAQTESPHRKGPNGFEGWTLLSPIEGRDDLPMALVISHHGRIVHRFSGDPFVWRWMLLDNGRLVAYEAGPLHFAMSCILADVRTGLKQASFNCFRELPEDAPSWIEQLEAQR